MEHKKNLLVAVSAVIVSGSFITLVTNNSEVFDGKHYVLKLMLTGQDLENFRTQLQGNEVVQIQLGTGTDAITYVAENKIGNVLYSDRLQDEKCYRIVWGSNGAAAAPIDVPPAPAVAGVGHFLFYDVPNKCGARPFNGGNVSTPVE